ncbi:VC0807 family protein [Segniliparus rugosus]|uniref:Intracellular septation protein A n=1 Tax=Segniliparus rugosus (strain ATCC BAA-974 / DSM 45345 / CCUG 50838 / CIP 108380 / JCM 13579 / CDC 945) TaxID=679197 RepID=E5XMF8_SEGRC|nr:VC0807 family protein [Segniliparus rugosus]EFV14470.1 hypothetical protein HMPREF9336_00678 [Segniliparus rugosus ATCC BAA-974]
MNNTHSLRAFIKSSLISAAPAILVYYALRAFGLVQYLALVGAIAVSLAQTLFGALRARKFDPGAGLVLLLASCALLVALTTKNARATQVADTAPGFLFATALLVSSAIRKPLTKKAASTVAFGLADDALPARGWTARDVLDWTAMHIRLSAFAGVFGLCQTAFALTVIFTCAVDISQAVIVVVGSGSTIFLLVHSVNRIRAFVKERDERASAAATSKTPTGSPS